MDTAYIPTSEIGVSGNDKCGDPPGAGDTRGLDPGFPIAEVIGQHGLAKMC